MEILFPFPLLFQAVALIGLSAPYQDFWPFCTFSWDFLWCTCIWCPPDICWPEWFASLSVPWFVLQDCPEIGENYSKMSKIWYFLFRKSKFCFCIFVSRYLQFTVSCEVAIVENHKLASWASNSSCHFYSCLQQHAAFCFMQKSLLYFLEKLKIM